MMDAQYGTSLTAGRALVALCVLVAPALVSAEPQWKTEATKGGVRLERRPVVGSSYYEYRATLTIPAPVAKVVGAVWDAITKDPGRTVRRRQVLSRADDELVIYDVVAARVVSDRDVTIRVRRRPRSDGTVEIPFETQNRLGPPASKNYVRIPVVRGRWILAPDPSGRTQLTYFCYSEPGGLVPAMLVRGAQRDQVFDDVKRVMARLR